MRVPHGSLVVTLDFRNNRHEPTRVAFVFVVGLLGLVTSPSVNRLQAKDPQIASSEPMSPIELIDRAINQNWHAFGLKPSKIEDDQKWARRVYLDIIGRIPDAREAQAFQQIRAKDKREKLVDLLLEDGQYTEEFAGHWSAVWSNLLIGRSGGTARNSFVSRQGMAKYLRDSFASNKPYDAMVRELITATGTTKPGTENFNGATNFLADKVNDEKATLATSATTRIFLGLKVQCAQCHNHPTDVWSQNKFWEMNAFFRQTRALRRYAQGTDRVDFIELIDEDFPGEAQPSTPSEADIYFDQPDGVTRVAFPIYLDGTEISRSGYVHEVNRRAELAKWIVEHENLALMMVNRTWAHFLGHGFTRPVEDLGLKVPISHPELLDRLAGEFRQSGYDIRQLIKWIVLSKPYQLSSATTSAQDVDDPSKGDIPQFSHFYSRQMSAEQLYESLITVGGVTRGSLEQQQAQRDRWLSQFVIAFGTDEGDESTTFNGTIPQVLMMFNGELMRNACKAEPGSFLGNVITADTRFENKIQELTQFALSRRATSAELRVAAQMLQSRPDKPQEVLQDIWWAILNSNEFIMVH